MGVEQSLSGNLIDFQKAKSLMPKRPLPFHAREEGHKVIDFQQEAISRLAQIALIKASNDTNEGFTTTRREADSLHKGTFVVIKNGNKRYAVSKYEITYTDPALCKDKLEMTITDLDRLGRDIFYETYMLSEDPKTAISFEDPDILRDFTFEEKNAFLQEILDSEVDPENTGILFSEMVNSFNTSPESDRELRWLNADWTEYSVR